MVIISRKSTVLPDSLCSGPQPGTRFTKKKCKNFELVSINHYYKRIFKISIPFQRCPLWRILIQKRYFYFYYICNFDSRSEPVLELVGGGEFIQEEDEEDEEDDDRLDEQVKPCFQMMLWRLDNCQWGSVTHQMAVPVPSISCCVLNHPNLSYQIHNALTFNWDMCCHLALCLRLLPFHWPGDIW